MWKAIFFYKNNNPFSAILGSANLNFIRSEANNLRQYEVLFLVDDVNEISHHIEALKTDECSKEVNRALDVVDLVKKESLKVESFKAKMSEIFFYSLKCAI